jgi:undecaprenyl-diphosphatase
MVAALTVSSASTLHAQQAAVDTPSAASNADAATDVASDLREPLSADDPTRKTTLTPHPIEAAPRDEHDERVRITADPVGDGALLAVSGGFDILAELVLSTGEIRPQQIDPNFSTNQLLGIDRGAISQHPDPNAATLSTVGLFTGIGYALLDPLLTGARRGPESGLVDAIMYAEAIAFTNSANDIAKVAVRRPRPYAYIDRNAYLRAGGDPATYDNTATDSALSFFSGHVATVAAISSTATYLAFARSPHSLKPWVTLVLGTALTTFVSIERVRAAAHFPTDVIAAAMAGGGIGTFVVHLHREDTLKQRPVWIGFSPPPQFDTSVEAHGGLLTLSGRF